MTKLPGNNPSSICKYDRYIIRVIHFHLLAVLITAITPLTMRIGEFVIFTPYVVITSTISLIIILLLSAGKYTAINWNASEILFGLACCLQIIGSIFSVNITVSLNTSAMWLFVALYYIALRILMAENALSHHDISRWIVWLLLVLLCIGMAEYMLDSNFAVIADYIGVKELENDYTSNSIRISGTTVNSNIYGQWLTIFSLLVNSFILFGKKMRTQRYVFLIFFLAVEMVVLASTLSRGSILFFIVGHILLFFIWLVSDKPRLVVRLFLLFMISIIGLIVFSTSTLDLDILMAINERIEVNSDTQRWAMLGYGIELLQYPKICLIGTGMGTFYPTLVEYGIGTDQVSIWKDFSSSSSGIHNVPMLLLVEGGIVVVTLYVSGYVLLLLRAYRQIKYLHINHKDFYFNATILSVLVSLSVPMMVYNSTVSIWLLLPIATFIAATNSSNVRLAKLNK